MENLKISSEKMSGLFSDRTSTISRDFKLNMKKILGESQLDTNETALALLALSVAAQWKEMADFARGILRENLVIEEQILEAAEAAALMGMLNTYYRFRHFIEKGPDEKARDLYRNAGLRMTGMAKPVLGKEQFEMLAFAVSVFNGCETCVSSHEKVLRDSGINENKIHNLARLAAIVKGSSVLSTL